MFSPINGRHLVAMTRDRDYDVLCRSSILGCHFFHGMNDANCLAIGDLHTLQIGYTAGPSLDVQQAPVETYSRPLSRRTAGPCRDVQQAPVETYSRPLSRRTAGPSHDVQQAPLTTYSRPLSRRTAGPSHDVPDNAHQMFLH